ncbi:MAG: ABC transporter ATP-binding protein [bacterium]|nr:ABC transporter ATP-binding protein [bacterium]
MEAEKVLVVKELTKDYKNIRAVDGVSFSVNKGEVVGLLGPNGAGKTTTINMILGVLEPTAGSVFIEGLDARTSRSLALGHTNFAAIYAQVPGNLTVWQNLYVFGLLYGVKNIRQRVSELIQEFELEMFRDTKCGLLSSGEQTRVHLAKAMINKPELLLLDEPTASLDPSASLVIRDKIRSYATSGAVGVLWTSHNMHEVELVCDRVLFLSRGKILMKGDPKTLPQSYGKKDLEELFIAVAREPLSLELESVL